MAVPFEHLPSNYSTFFKLEFLQNIAFSSSRFQHRPRSSFRRSARTSARSADSGYGFSEAAPPSSHSDTELRYARDEFEVCELPRGASLPRMRPSPKKPNARNNKQLQHQQSGGGSLDRKHVLESALVDPLLLAKTPILCNKYVVEGGDRIVNHSSLDVPKEKERASSVPRSQHLAPPLVSSRSSSRDDLNSIRDVPRRKRPSRKKLEKL